MTNEKESKAKPLANIEEEKNKKNENVVKKGKDAPKEEELVTINNFSTLFQSNFIVFLLKSLKRTSNCKRN